MKLMAICAVSALHRFSHQTAAFASCTLILIDYTTASAQKYASDTPGAEVASNCCTVIVDKSYRIDLRSATA
jgi:hypothetical protein